MLRTCSGIWTHRNLPSKHNFSYQQSTSLSIVADVALHHHRVLVSSTLNTETFSTTVKVLPREAFLQAPMSHSSPKPGKHPLIPSVQGLNQLRVVWVFVLFFLQPMEPYCPTTALGKRNETTIGPSGSYAKQERKRLGKGYPYNCSTERT